MEGTPKLPGSTSSRNEVEEEGKDECEPDLPLSVQIEGKNRMLSVAVISLTALMMELYRSSGEVKKDSRSIVNDFEDHFNYSIPIHRLFGLVIWIFVLSFYSGCIVCTMYVNINPRKKGWMKRRVCSCLGLLCWNTFVVPTFMSEVVTVYDGEKDSFGRIDISNTRGSIAYMILLAIVFIATNLGFIILPCFWSPVSQHPTSEELPVGVVIDEGSSGGSAAHTNGEVPPEGAPTLAAGKDVSLPRKDFVIRTIQHKAQPLRTWDTTVFRERAELERSTELNIAVQSEFEGTNTGWIEKKAQYLKESLFRIWKHVREEDKFQYSVWVIAAVVVSVVLLFKNMRTSIEFLQKIAYDIQIAAQDTLEAERRQVDSVSKLTNPLEKARALIDNAEEVFSELLATGNLSEYRPDVVEIVHQLAEFKNLTVVNVTSWLDSITTILDQNVGLNFAASPAYFSEYCKVMKGTIVVGFLIGTAIGLHAVYTVLAAHKKTSLQLLREMKRSDDRGSGFGIEDKYPIGKAVFFLGVLVSTALVQQTIFGVILSALLGIIFTYRGYSAFMQFGGYWLLALVITILVNQLIIRFVGNKRLSDGYRVKRPTGFLLYMCLFSMLHFVLGIYYAIFRLILLLFTTLFILSRLDVTIFTTGKRFDNGHNAFMATLLLTRVIQQNIRETSSEEVSERVSSRSE